MNFMCFATLIISLTVCSFCQGSIISSINSTAFKIIHDSHLSKDCASDLNSLMVDIFDLKLWAVKMFDSSGKLYPGLLHGNFHLLGDYDQCLSIREKVNERTVRGQYCTVLITIKQQVLGPLEPLLNIRKLFKNIDKIDLKGLSVLTNNVTLPFGICIPKSCSVKDLENIVQNIEQNFDTFTKASVLQELCVSKNIPKDINNLDSAIYFFFMVIFFIIIASTIYDLYLRAWGKNSNNVIVFSAYTNVKRLFSDRPNNHNTLTCLNGIKVLTMIWLVLGDLVINSIFVSKNPFFIVTKWKQQVLNTFIWSAIYGADTFLTISGLLASYIYLKHSEKFSVSLSSFYLIRYIRLTPALLATVLIHTSVLKHFADGPYGAYVIRTFTEECYNTWWTVFFYSLNAANCASQTWYLSVDFKLYLCAPLILFFIKKYPKQVLTGMLMAFVVGISYSIIVTFSMKIGFSAFDWNENFKNYIFYSAMHHLPCWLIGISFGYIIYYQKLKISKPLNLFLWIVSLIAMQKLITNQVTFVEGEYNVYLAALWNGFARPVWSLALCFIIYSCQIGKGGFVNSFLSHSIFRFFGKLTYSLYLIHTSRSIVVSSSMKETFYFGNIQTILNLSSVAVVLVICATILYLAFEAPLIALKDQMEKRGSKKFVTKSI